MLKFKLQLDKQAGLTICEFFLRKTSIIFKDVRIFFTDICYNNELERSDKYKLIHITYKLSTMTFTNMTRNVPTTKYSISRMFTGFWPHWLFGTLFVQFTINHTLWRLTSSLDFCTVWSTYMTVESNIAGLNSWSKFWTSFM